MLDYLAKENKEWFDAQNKFEEDPTSHLFDKFGNYRKRTNNNEQDLHYFNANYYQEDDVDDFIQDCVDHARVNYVTVKKRT